MSATSKTRKERQILLVGPYGVLGTGVIDAVAENPKWGITTAARRPPPAYRAPAAPLHISVDLMDRESTKNAFSSLDNVTDLVFAALAGLLKNRSKVVPGRMNRILNAIVPASLARKMEADLLGRGLASKSASANARAA